jgi:hypothetical protein
MSQPSKERCSEPAKRAPDYSPGWSEAEPWVEHRRTAQARKAGERGFECVRSAATLRGLSNRRASLPTVPLSLYRGLYSAACFAGCAPLEAVPVLITAGQFFKGRTALDRQFFGVLSCRVN